MARRFHDALLIQEGACNPSGIAHSLVNACRECLDENVTQHTDPAVRLIIHQLAHLARVGEIDSGATNVYSELVASCKRKAGQL